MQSAKDFLGQKNGVRRASSFYYVYIFTLENEKLKNQHLENVEMISSPVAVSKIGQETDRDPFLRKKQKITYLKQNFTFYFIKQSPLSTVVAY